MESRINVVAVGLFVVLLGALLAGGVLWMRHGIGGVHTAPYLVYSQESVSGLARDSVVTYLGVDAGRVREIGLHDGNPGEVRILIELRQSMPVNVDTVATLQVALLTGTATLELTGGTAQSPRLKPRDGEAIPVIPSAPSWYARFQKMLLELGKSFDALSGSLSDVFGEEGARNLRQILADLQSLSSTLAAHRDDLGRFMGDARSSAENLEQLTRVLSRRLPAILTDMSQLSSGLKTDVPSLVASLRDTSGQLQKTGQSIEALANDGRVGLRQFTSGNLGGVQSMLTELRQLTANLNRLALLLEREPNILLRGRTETRRGPGE